MKYLLLFTFMLISIHLQAQNFVRGYVTDSLSGEALIAASVFDEVTKQAVVTNAYGYFQLTTDSDKSILSVHYIGYQVKTIVIDAPLSGLLKIGLVSNIDLPEVEILENKSTIAESLGNFNMSIETLENIPSLLGEVDILKALSFMPGVSTGSEGSSGILVRGGSADQNLILVDGARVYNTNHLFGFLSVFNAEAVKSVELIKGGFPAQYGGRLSSIINVNMKEGNLKKYRTSVGIGLINSNFMTEGPIVKDKVSFMVSGRISNLSSILWAQKRAYENDNRDAYSNYLMYDFNSKFNIKLSENERLFFSFYHGKDDLRTVSRGSYSDNGLSNTLLNWGNNTASVRYTKIGQKYFSEIQLAYNDYHYVYNINNIDTSNLLFNLENRSESFIRDFSLKSNLDYQLGEAHTLNAGIELINHYFQPNFIEQKIGNIIIPTAYELIDFYALETGLFVHHNWNISSKLNFNSGLRWSSYWIEKENFQNLEPRLSFSYQLDSFSFLRIGGSRMTQPIHLLTNNGTSLPNELWVPATTDAVPQTALQLDIGYKRVMKHYSTSIELFYKKFEHLIDYSEGEQVLFNAEKYWEETISTNGIGKAYGLEFFLSKDIGKWQGWLGYTLSWNYRKFENINKGKWFIANYDRRHDLEFTINRKLKKGWRINSNFVLASGIPVTLPEAIVRNHLGGYNFIYAQRNGQRFPTYNRMDIGLVKEKTTKRGNLSNWSIGAYNVYAFPNPYYFDFFAGRKEDSNLVEIGTEGELVSTNLFTFIPFIKYSITFK